ncbi:unnamed protein product [Amoebophrya sp. A25]|nr:unnamed protein product [Amoebophrya sp. A25]|eukprot:GSA25T00019966001.1
MAPIIVQHHLHQPLGPDVTRSLWQLWDQFHAWLALRNVTDTYVDTLRQKVSRCAAAEAADNSRSGGSSGEESGSSSDSTGDAGDEENEDTGMEEEACAAAKMRMPRVLEAIEDSAAQSGHQMRRLREQLDKARALVSELQEKANSEQEMKASSAINVEDGHRHGGEDEVQVEAHGKNTEDEDEEDSTNINTQGQEEEHVDGDHNDMDEQEV